MPLQPLQVTIGYWSVNDPKSYSASNFPVYINYKSPHVYGFPCNEYPNLIKCSVHNGDPCDPDERSYKSGKKMMDELAVPFLRKVLKGVKNPETPVRTESCLYTQTPDGDFILDLVPHHPNIIVGCGFSGHGFKLAPVSGFILAKLALEGKHPFMHLKDRFSASRFHATVSKL